MNTAPIAAAPSDISGLPPSAPPSAPGRLTFSDMLVSATSSLAAFALLPTSANDALSGMGHTRSAPKKDPNNDNAAVPVAMPAPAPAPVAAPASADADGSSASPATTVAASNTQQSQQGAQTDSTGSTGTGGASSGSAQTANGAALPPMAAELNTRIALGAQALLSQPSQVLATLPHGALQSATPTLSPNLNAAAHGAAATDPTSALPKLAASATVTAATSGTMPQTIETALQTATAETAASTATAAATDADTATAASASDPTDQPDPALAATPAPAAVPLPATDAAANLGDTLPPAVAASALDQVAANLSQVGKLGLSQIEIQLKPAALGTVDVKLELTHDGRVAAVISADRSDTLMQLQRGSGELQQALRDAGLQTDSGSLSFNLRSDAQTSDQSGRHLGYAAPQPDASSAGDDVLAGPAAVASASQSAHSGLLNIQV